MDVVYSTGVGTGTSAAACPGVAARSRPGVVPAGLGPVLQILLNGLRKGWLVHFLLHLLPAVVVPGYCYLPSSASSFPLWNRVQRPIFASLGFHIFFASLGFRICRIWILCIEAIYGAWYYRAISTVR